MDLVNRGWSTNFAESNCSLGCKIENITLDSILLQLSLEKKRKGQLSFAVGGLTTSCIQADWTIIQCKCMQMKQRKPIVQAGDTVIRTCLKERISPMHERSTSSIADLRARRRSSYRVAHTLFPARLTTSHNIPPTHPSVRHTRHEKFQARNHAV
jgi:hypothetical protein